MKIFNFHSALLCTVFLSISPSCKKEAPASPTILEVNNNQIESVGYMDSLIEDIQLVALETTLNGLISDYANQVIITKDNTLVLISFGLNASLAFFDLKNGKFIKKILPAGEGPGEFKYLGEVTYNPFDNEIEIMPSFQRKEIILDSKGNFIRENPIKLHYAAKHYLTKDIIVYSYRQPNAHLFKTNTSFQLAMYHKENKSWATYLEADEKIEESRDFATAYQFFRNTSGQTTWFKPFSDQIHTMHENGITPTYRIKFSQNNVPDNFWEKNAKYQSFFQAFSNHNFPFLPSFYMETENLVLFPYKYDNSKPVFAYDKKNQKNLFNAYQLGIEQMDLNLSTIMHPHENALVYLVSPQDLIHVMQNHPNPSLLPKAFHDIHKTLKATDNPVLMIIKLK